MNQLLIVIPFCTNDAVLAERLCDFIFLVNRRVKKWSVLLAASNDVHAELVGKVRAAAEVAFENVDFITVPATVDPNKNIHINRMFHTIATHISKTYRTPFLWLEPDCVPIDEDWFDKISAKHYEQTKRYSGSWLMGRHLFQARVSVYPPDAINDFVAGNAPFNMLNGESVVAKSTKTRLVQESHVTDPAFQANEGVVLIHHDKGGILIETLREKFERLATKPAKGKK